jgi:phosphatidylglycerol:prolipoprotein diacylglycerol transferase
MLKVLFHIGSFPVHSYGVVLIIGFMVGLLIARKRAPRFGINPNKLTDMSFIALIAGVFGARIVFLLQEPPPTWQGYFDWQFAGLTSFGGIIGGALVVLLWARKNRISTAAVLDTMGPAFLVSHAIGRIGCLLNGCCAGGVCPPGTPWGIHLGNSHFLFHPAQVYDSLMNLAAFGLVLWIEKRGLKLGQIFSVVLMLHGTARFIYEFWRAGTPEQVREGLASSTYWGSLPITEAHVAALAIIVMGAVLYFVYARNQVAPEPGPQQEPQPA